MFTSGQYKGQCKEAQPVSGGPYTIAASVTVPATLPIGLYTVTVSAIATNGLDLGSMPSFTLEVTPAGHAPSVTIDTPANGSSFLVNEPIAASVDIISDLPITAGTARLNGNPVTLSFNSGNADWEAFIILSQPGTNAFTVQACNAVGCTSATSTFTVHYNFGGWLPPITTAKFQSGRTLPVKFRVADYNGLANSAVASVSLDGFAQGTAYVLYDSTGPYYQLEIQLNVPAGAHQVGVSLNDGVTRATYPITVK